MIGKALLTGAGVGGLTIGGTMAGAYYGAQTTDNPAPTAIAGGAIGAGIGIGATAIAYNADKITGAVGAGALGIGKKAYDFAAAGGLQNIGIGALEGAKTLGSGALYGAGKTAQAVTPVLASGALKAGAKYGNIASSMFRVNPDFLTKDSGRMLNFTKRGLAIGGASVIAGGVMEGFKTFNDAKAGYSDGYVATATPVAPTYNSQVRNAGATGDLAFAMRAQRNG